MPKQTKIISWLVGNIGEMVIYAFFFIFQFFLYQKQNKKKTENKQKHVKQSKA